MILKNGLVLKDNELFKLDVRVKGDKIVEIGLDLKGKMLLMSRWMDHPVQLMCMFI